MSESDHEPTIHERKDAAFRLNRGVCRLIEEAAHLPIAIRRSVAVIDAGALIVPGARAERSFVMTARALVCLFVVLSFAPLSAWKNPRKSDALNAPVFGTHDWIAIKGYVQAGRPAFINNNLNRYFIGTEAPDNGFKPANAEGATKTPQPVTASCLMRTEA